MYQNYLEKIKTKLLPVVLVVKNYWEKIPYQYRKVIKIVGIAFGILVFLLLVFSVITGVSKRRAAMITRKTVPSAAPQETSFPEETITNPSRYATDAAVLQIEANLKTVGNELNATKINDPDLLPPRLDFEINFDK